MLCSWASYCILCLALAQPRKTCPDLNEKLLTGAYSIQMNKNSSTHYQNSKQQCRLWLPGDKKFSWKCVDNMFNILEKERAKIVLFVLFSRNFIILLSAGNQYMSQYSYFGTYHTYMSRKMRFPTMWYVRPPKPQISLHIRAVWSEPLLVA